jgi:nucleotide-binding universal stress UspA family protein
MECGDIGPVLASIASRSGDLLVIGTGRQTGLGRVLRSPVGRYCLAHARCPVLVVPPPALMDEVGHGLRSWHLRRRMLTPDL